MDTDTPLTNLLKWLEDTLMYDTVERSLHAEKSRDSDFALYSILFSVISMVNSAVYWAPTSTEALHY